MMRAYRSYIKICYTSGCPNYTENPMVDYCASCAKSMRKAEKQSIKDDQKRKAALLKRPDPRKTPNKVSEKRKAENLEYSRLREDFLKTNPECQAGIEGTCTHESEDVHHMKGRGILLNETKFWLAVCRNCHIFITDHPLGALKRNLSFSRLSTNETI